MARIFCIIFLIFLFMTIRSDRYFQWVRQEIPVCRVFQNYLEYKNGTKTFLQKRKKVNAHIDFLWREYSSTSNVTLRELAVEIRTISVSSQWIQDENQGYIEFPIVKLNECMKFWRMGKWVYIVYQLSDMIWVLDWDYYLKHNFELSGDFQKVLLPFRNFIVIA